ncbi:MAG: cupin domain-containing protein [Ignavibacteriales bacterium]
MESINIKNIKEIKIFPGYFAKIIHSKEMTIAYFRVIAGYEVPEHSHFQEQICRVVEGDFELTVEGNKIKMDENSVVIIPAHAKHSAKAISDCRVIDTFHPVREDYKR